MSEMVCSIDVSCQLRRARLLSASQKIVSRVEDNVGICRNKHILAALLTALMLSASNE